MFFTKEHNLLLGELKKIVKNACSITVALALLSSLAITSCASSKKASAGANTDVVSRASKKSSAKVSAIKASVSSLGDIDKYGDIRLSTTTQELLAAGYEYADIVSVKFLDKVLELPLIPAYRYVAAKGSALVAFKGEDSRPLELEIFNGSFADTYGVATKTTNADKSYFWTAKEGVTFPISVEISLAKKQGYFNEYAIFDLKRTNNRVDYNHISDAEFGNFREVTTSGMAAKKLYRSSSPINPDIGRNIYVDIQAKNAGIKTFMNLADSKQTAEKYEGYASSYYSKQNICFLALGVDFSTEVNRTGLAEGLRYFISHEGPFLVHCNEGQDRAGFVSAILECLMGASLNEVKGDYMTTFENYYGVKKGSAQYKAISENIEKNLRTAFGVKKLEGLNLKDAASTYIKGLGLSDNEISALRAKLGN